MLFIVFYWFTIISVNVKAVENCEKMIREERCREIFENIGHCNDMAYRPQLMSCLVTCGKCDAFTCNNPQPDSVVNCTALYPQCNSTKWQRFMKEKCPSTCGKCDVKNANLCKDVSDSLICSTLARFCNTLDYYDDMSEQCASTCNRCPADGHSDKCVDFAKDCSSRKELCSNPAYDGLMHRACAKTCNKCHGCFDTSSKCSTWLEHGFCTKFDPKTQKQYCAKTCKMCKV
ncbi:shTK domain protein [Dictyocaulus viviparus]|uniref:ShTK domain protein n=1 Tax=Dictyocaulus viviparus TaxID=29172 RepID=A0A0D8XLX3_DICVI|nr:shTK domain protein [Dictyocaulus viviparus]